MSDLHKAKEQLIEEVAALRQQVAELEARGTQSGETRGELARYPQKLCRERAAELLVANESLRESEARHKTMYTMFRLMADNMSDLLWAKDMEGRYTFVNKAICDKLLNAGDIAEPLGKTDMFFAAREKEAHPDAPEWHTFGTICVDSDTVVIDSCQPGRFDEFGNVQGEPLHLDVYKAPIWNERGEMIGTVGSGQIVTREKELEKERARAEEALRQHRDHLEALVAERTAKLLDVNERLREEIAHRQQVEAEMLRRNQELAFLHRIEQELSSSLDLKQVLQISLDGIRNLLNITACSIWLNDSKTNDLVCEGASSPPQGDLVRGWRLSPGQGLVGWVSQHDRSLLVPDSWNDERFFAGVDKQTGLTSRSVLCVPLRAKRWTIGVLQVLDERTNYFDEADVRLLEKLAISMSSAIENAQLYTKARREIAERVRVEEKVQQQNKFLNNILASLTHPFYVINVSDYTVAIANDAAKKMGLTEGGTTCCYLLHRRDTPCSGDEHPCPIQEITQTKKPVTVKHTHYDAAGNPRNVRIYGYPIFGKEGNVSQIIEYSMDITEQVQARRMLLRSERFAAVGILAASVAHEIQNPLQSVLGCIGLAQEAIEEGREADKYFEVAYDSVRRVSGIVAQMRDMYRPPVEEKRPVDVNVLLEKVLTLTHKQSEKGNVEIVWQPTADLPALMLVSDQIHQVFLNLTLNALEAMPDGGKLQVSTTLNGKLPRVSIQFIDNGVGIAPDDLPHIFEPFHTSKSTGTGLGLAISFGIVEQHGGMIEANSREGAGSTFTVWLPIVGWEGLCDDGDHTCFSGG